MHEIVASRVDWRLGGRRLWRKAIAIASYRFVLAAAKRAAKSKMLGVLKWSGSWQCSVQCTVECRKEVQWVGRDFDLHKNVKCEMCEGDWGLEVSFIWCAIDFAIRSANSSIN